jgi:hypothetical protein
MTREASLTNVSAFTCQLQLVGLASVAAAILSEDWLAGLAVGVLWLGWRLLGVGNSFLVLALAFTFQWLQVVSGVFYYGFTGHQLPTMIQSDYRPMVLIGLGCLVALLAGLTLGRWLLRLQTALDEKRPVLAFRWQELIWGYLAAILLVGSLQEWAWHIPRLTQAVLVMGYSRYALLFLILRRLMHPHVQWSWIVTGVTALPHAVVGG